MNAQLSPANLFDDVTTPRSPGGTRIVMGPPPAATQDFDADDWQELAKARRRPAKRRGRWFNRSLWLVVVGVLLGSAWQRPPTAAWPVQLQGAAELASRLTHKLYRLGMVRLPREVASLAATLRAPVPAAAAGQPQPSTAWQCCPGDAPEAAAAAYRATLQSAPAALPPRISLGFCLLRLQDPAAASQQFAEVLTQAPWEPQAQLGLGQALLQLGKTREAQRHFRQVLAIAPETAMAGEARRNLEQTAR